MAPEICPNCDCAVPAGARACPECGADESTGWSPGARCDRLGIRDPDEEFDYGAFVKTEFGPRKPGRRGPGFFWTLTAVVLLLAVLAWAL